MPGVAFLFRIKADAIAGIKKQAQVMAGITGQAPGVWAFRTIRSFVSVRATHLLCGFVWCCT